MRLEEKILPLQGLLRRVLACIRQKQVEVHHFRSGDVEGQSLRLLLERDALRVCRVVILRQRKIGSPSQWNPHPQPTVVHAMPCITCQPSETRNGA